MKRIKVEQLQARNMRMRGRDIRTRVKMKIKWKEWIKRKIYRSGVEMKEDKIAQQT